MGYYLLHQRVAANL